MNPSAARNRPGPPDEAPAVRLRLLERPAHPPRPTALAGVPPRPGHGWLGRALARGLQWLAGPRGSRT